VRMKSKK